MSAMPANRRYHVQLDLGADTPEEIERVLRQLETDLYIDRERLLSGSGCVMDIASGGYESGYTLRIDLDPEMTGDIYRERLEAWRAAQVRERTTT